MLTSSSYFYDNGCIFYLMSFVPPWNHSIVHLNILIRQSKHLVILSWALFIFSFFNSIDPRSQILRITGLSSFYGLVLLPDNIYLRHLRKKSYHLFYRLKWVEVSFLFERLEVISVTCTDGVIFNDGFLRPWVMKLNFGHYIQTHTINKVP